MTTMFLNLLLATGSAWAIPIYSYTQNDNQLLVELKIGNMENQLFLINPSFNYSMIQESLAVQQNMPAIMSANGRAKIGTSELWIGNHKIEKAQFILINQGLRKNLGAAPFAGIIGSDLLQDLTLDIDLSNNTLRVVDTKLDESDKLWSMTSSGLLTSVDVSYGEQGKEEQLTVPITLNFDDDQIQFDTQQFQGVGDDSIERIHLSGSSFKPKDYRLTQGNEIGIGALDGHQLIIDFQSKRLRLNKKLFSKRKADINKVRLERLEWNFEPEILKEKAGYQIYNSEIRNASQTLMTHLKNEPDDLASKALYIELQLQLDNPAPLFAEQDNTDFLIENRLWLKMTNSLWLRGNAKAAQTLIEKQLHTENADVLLSYADLLAHQGDHAKARVIVGKAANLRGDPNAYLLRRAWYAYEDNDAYASLTYIRKKLQQSEIASSELYFYSRIFNTPDFSHILSQDIINYISTEKSNRGGYDYQAVALYAIKQYEAANDFHQRGIEKNCQILRQKADAVNCRHWFDILLYKDGIKAKKQMKRLIKKYPNRSDYLDTYALLLSNQKEKTSAREHAHRAALLSPTSAYMLWQLKLLE